MSETKVDAWMPLWIGSYLADTTHLSRDQHGGYLLLLMAYWRNKGPLIDRGDALANIVKATPGEWRRKLRPVLEQFFNVDGEVWTHGRAERELEAAGMRKAAAVNKAQAAAEARWEKHRKECSEHAPSSAQALLKDCPTPSPISSLPSSEKRAPRKRSAAPAVDKPEGVSEEAWRDWLDLRRRKRASVTPLVLEFAQQEAAKASLTLDQFLRAWVYRGSQGLQAEWLTSSDRARVVPTAPPPAESAESIERRRREAQYEADMRDPAKRAQMNAVRAAALGAVKVAGRAPAGAPAAAPTQAAATT